MKETSIISDGTAQIGEALAIEDCKQRVVCLQVLAKPLKGNEVAQRLMTLIVLNHNFGPNMVFDGMRDGAAVNGAAIKQLLFFYPNIMDVIFFSHAINDVGCHFEFKSFGHISPQLGKSIFP